MDTRKKTAFSLTTFLLLSGHISTAQDGEIENTLRSNGMIYVVVGVLVIIFIGILIYLVNLDKKVGRLEKEIEELN